MSDAPAQKTEPKLAPGEKSGLAAGKKGGLAEGENKDLIRYGQPLDYTYLMGTYMAVNAVAGSVILIDGPDCAVGKVEHIFGKHDMRSTLLECTGLNRVECSFTDARNTVLSRYKAVTDGMTAMAAREDVKALFLCSLPMTFVAGTDYNMILKQVSQSGVKKPLYYLPPRSLQAGHLEGYEEVLNALAEGISLPETTTDPNKVAVIGYFMDRLEEDHFGNLRELRRMLKALGKELVSVWCDGCAHDDLGKAAAAGTLVALPYARRAARALAKRTGAEVVEADLPVGIDGTKRWIEALGRAFGAEKKAKRFVDAELKRIIPRMEWVVPHVFLNHKFWVSADPYLLSPLAGFFEELGGLIVGAASVGEQLDVRSGRKKGAKGRQNETKLPENVSMALVRPTSGALEVELRRAVKEGANLVVGNSDVTQLVPRSVPILQLGYPSYTWHALHSSPYMGFEGVLVLMDRVANAIAASRAPRAETADFESGTTIRPG